MSDRSRRECRQSLSTDTRHLVVSAFGTDRWWQDGLKENYHVVQKFLEYSHSQHLAKKLWKPEEVHRSPGLAFEGA